ncbi:MAG: ribbon-helix-helix domain-containing protein [Thermoanaerobaculales bacterium]|jgi:hypothetical protein|nr:ribbon-helix-helix domain-containing protein [Thermoanaerobaculales bacterium]
MNLTVTVDDDLLAKARERAAQQGTSVQEIIRQHLAEYVGQRSREEVAKELVELLRSTGGRSGGKKFRREDAYEGRV